MITALVLAAGRSQRMGTQKLLLPLGKQSVLARVVDALSRTSLHPTIVVVGRDAALIRQSLRDYRVLYTVNPDPEGDMLSSVRCGLRAIPKSCKGALVALGDHPAIQSAWIEQMLRLFHEDRGQLVVPVYRGRRGHPILISAQLFDEVLSEYDGVGLRGLLQAHQERVSLMEVDSPGVLEDLDTPEDYQRQRSSLESDVQGWQK